MPLTKPRLTKVAELPGQLKNSGQWKTIPVKTKNMFHDKTLLSKLSSFWSNLCFNKLSAAAPPLPQDERMLKLSEEKYFKIGLKTTTPTSIFFSFFFFNKIGFFGAAWAAKKKKFRDITTTSSGWEETQTLGRKIFQKQDDFFLKVG